MKSLQRKNIVVKVLSTKFKVVFSNLTILYMTVCKVAFVVCYIDNDFFVQWQRLSNDSSQWLFGLIYIYFQHLPSSWRCSDHRRKRTSRVRPRTQDIQCISSLIESSPSCCKSIISSYLDCLSESYNYDWYLICIVIFFVVESY
jgi:hypothetical protein